MKVFGRSVAVLVLIMLMCAATAFAEWRIDIESKTVAPGETDVSIDINVYWDLDLQQITIPVIVREIDAGSFWTGSLPYDTLGNPGRGSNRITWNPDIISWAIVNRDMRIGEPSTPCVTDGDIGYDGVSPDHFVIVTHGVVGLLPMPDGDTLLTFQFDVTSIAGMFEFDMACFSLPLNAIYMIDNVFPPIDHGPTGPEAGSFTFNKGVITIQGAANQAPEWGPIGAQSVDEGANLNFGVSATDPDSDPLTLTAENPPTGATFTDNGGGNGTFDWTPGLDQSGNYEVRFIASDGTAADTELVAITVADAGGILGSEDAGVPFEYELAQNYPNPFNATTRIDFTLKHSSVVSLEIFNILGQNVATPVANQYLDAGPQSATWNGQSADGQSASSGIYFYRLTTADFVEMKKMVLTK